MKVTLKDVAKRAGVDPSTVSRVVNNNTKVSIRDDTRQKVLKAIRELDYHPDVIARSLRLNTSGAVGMLVPDITNPMMPEVIQGVESRASEMDLSLMLCHTRDLHEKELKMTRFFLSRRVDGLLLATSHMTDDTITEIEEAGIPYVLVNRGNRKVNCAYVIADNMGGAKLAVRHLIDLGHRKIAHIAGYLHTDSGIERLSGFRDECIAANIRLDPEYVIETGYSELAGYNAMNKLLLLSNPPTAVFTVNDLTAMGAITAITERGMRVPEDISIVGFDDIWVASRLSPALTTVKVPLYDMGYLAMKMLFEKMNRAPMEQDRIVLETSLVVRRSTARATP